MQAYKAAENFYNAAGPDASCHVNRQAFPRVLVDHRQAFQRLTVGASVIHEIVAPDAVPAGGLTWARL